ncbi:MAG: hypothetical protein O7F73_11165 [Gammaproteobacteria bacterium]|nr:hypothetical protein [Gammaproteobacteria bacterium]
MPRVASISSIERPDDSEKAERESVPLVYIHPWIIGQWHLNWQYHLLSFRDQGGRGDLVDTVMMGVVGFRLMECTKLNSRLAGNDGNLIEEALTMQPSETSYGINYLNLSG